MKKILILLICAWILQSCAHTLLEPALDKIDAVGGAGIANENGSKSFGPKIGGQIGVETKIHQFKKNSSVGAGLGFSFQGAAYDEEMYSGKIVLTYLNVPLLYTYKSNVGIYGEAGLQPQILLFAKDKFDGGNYNYREYMNSFDLGLPIGVGYNINDKLSIGARATFGLINLDNSDSDVKDHNFLLAGIVRYCLNLPSKKSDDK